MQRHTFSFLAAVTTLALVYLGHARDLRHVTEPKTPPICEALKAGGTDDTRTIQSALDSCAKGKAVALSSGVFYSGPLTIPSGVSLMVGEGVTLKATTNASRYDLGSHTCGTIDEYGLGCRPFITMHGARGSGIYGKGTIDGRGGTRMAGSNITWWHLARNALAVRKLQNNPRLVQINNSADITVHGVTLTNSPFYTLVASETSGFTVWGVKIVNPSSALNTDGIDPVGCQNVTIAHCNISTGDDDVAIKALTAPSRHVSVLNNHFNHGVGMSIGSETNHGVSDVTVSGLTINGTHMGLYIKSNTFRGGLVSNVAYDNVCISNADWPVQLDANYYNIHGNHTPVFRNITLSNVRVLTNGTYIIHGLSAANPIDVTLKNVHIAKGSKFSVRNAKITGTWIEDASGSCGYAGNN
ncbi:endo-polygalacturonase-like [Bacillus rossius redtenbacheri]|uniref:endo-polygalacturonase-like n=1 Tax=Bacillus rossius redtenbacheri TaxID=93214 RepID=UPI002FDD67C4